ncbi:MAG: ATP-binding protein [bacterium]|nr:ATP-binding protein [bacterium]
MKKICFVEIENFKTFGDKVHIDLEHPAVLIGPNNAGKTSVIQALALWSYGIGAWYEKKGTPRKKEKLARFTAGINRLNILEVPVSEARFFWYNTRVRKGNTPIKITINVGIKQNETIQNCRMTFTQRDSEIIYCKPCPETVKNDDLLKTASDLQFNLLYSMSGIESEEPLVQEGRINVLMGQGQTAQVLRNLCYKVVENSPENPDWKEISKNMKKLFAIELKKPQLNPNRGNLILKYSQQDVDNQLDISLAGRGLQQVLLLLAYLYSHKGTILMIDEPDAHLEILRQKQVYEILKTVALQNQCQVIIATHSEVILGDAVDTNLTLLINGEAVNLATKNDMKNALRSFGIEHYYKAQLLPNILYLESSTDMEMLTILAKKLGHEAHDILTGRFNYYYTRNPAYEDSLDNKLDRAGGAFTDFKKHFYTLKRFVEQFKGIAIFDSDRRDAVDEITEDLAVLYWKNYELENYFISPEIILKFIKAHFEEASLFESTYYNSAEAIIKRRLLTDVFNGKESDFQEFQKLSASLRRTFLKDLKMSRFTEEVLQEFAEEQKQPILLKKGEFSKLIDYINHDDILQEVTEKLDLLVKYLKAEE